MAAPQMANLLSSGLAGLDALFGGGIPRSTVHLCYGEPMNAFDLMGPHFAAAATRTGHALYLSTDRTKEEVEDAVTKVGGNKARLTVLELPYEGAWLPEEVDPDTRVVIDSLSAIVLKVGFDETWAALQELRKQVRGGKENLLVLATGGLLPEQQMLMLRQWADGVLELGFDRQGFGLYPFLKITKMRGVPDASRLLLVKETERGMTLDSTKRVF